MIRLIEYLITRRRLTQAHRTSHNRNPAPEPQATSNNPRVGTGKSPVGEVKLRA